MLVTAADTLRGLLLSECTRHSQKINGFFASADSLSMACPNARSAESNHMMNSLKQAAGKRLAGFLSKRLSGYQRFEAASIDQTASVLRAGDILLVDGNTRISTAIKYLTQSSWSHACLYVGRGGESSNAETLLEADLQDGVRLVSPNYYAGFNLRICRPVGLNDDDRSDLIAFGLAKLGNQYDKKNVFDLVRYLIQKPVVPNRLRRAMIGLGSGEPTKAICSTLIAEAFQSIDYPILPLREAALEGKASGPFGDEAVGRGGEVPLFYRRHFTHYTPRDFDLSPYFRVVKPTLEQGFDYRKLRWGDAGESPPGF